MPAFFRSFRVKNVKLCCFLIGGHSVISDIGVYLPQENHYLYFVFWILNVSQENSPFFYNII